MNKGIAVAGNMIVDKIKVISAYPARHELTKIISITDSFGGAVCNTGMDLARLDPSLPVKAIGVVGDDEDGENILRTLTGHKNMDVSGVIRRGKNAFTDVLSEADGGARTFLYYSGSCDDFGVDDVDIDKLDCDIFHIGYILLLSALDAPDAEYGTKMARLLARVKAKGILTSVDVVSETGDRYKKLVPPSLKYADFFIVNEIEAGNTVGLELCDSNKRVIPELAREALLRLRSMGVARWAVIHAPEGAWGMDATETLAYSPSVRLPEGYVRGTVGAGDAFCAGALYAAYMGLPLHEGLRYGNASAACSLGGVSGWDGMTDMQTALKRFAP